MYLATFSAVGVNGTIGGSVVFSDLDGDDAPEVVAATDTGNILALYLDGRDVTYFPILRPDKVCQI